MRKVQFIMKSLLILSFTILCAGSTGKDVEVFICTGAYSECYHIKKDCEGLENCSKEIKSITLKEAKRMGRRECSYCYQKK